MINQRKHVRIGWETEIDIEWSGQKRSGRTRNVSLGGLFVAMGDPPPFGERVTIHVRLPGVAEACAVQSVVRWSQPGEGFGAQFERLRAVEVRGLNRLLHDLAPSNEEAP